MSNMARKPSYDKKGYPIRPGDVLKVYHFTDYRNRKHYMYKLAWHLELNGKTYLMGCHLGEDSIPGCTTKNSFSIPSGILEDYQIVQGYCTDADQSELDFKDRPRVEEPLNE